MKATYYLPAHPSYFEDDYSQEEIDAAFVTLDRLFKGVFRSRKVGLIDHEYVLLREPGKSVTVTFESAGMGDEQTSEQDKQIAVDQHRRVSSEELQTHVRNITNMLEGNRKFPENS